MKDLFVFAGQSNMMGASVYAPVHSINTADSFEYKYSLRQRGISQTGEFVPAAHPAGEYAYRDLAEAYAPDNVDENGKSKTCNYAVTTTFVCAESNLKNEEDKSEYRFAEFSEHSFLPGASLPPIFAADWEKLGHSSLYAHIAKGSTTITHYFDDAMAEDYNKRMLQYNTEHGTDYPTDLQIDDMSRDAVAYFTRKTQAFFDEAAERCGAPHSVNFVWLQGESDFELSTAEYKMRLSVLWDRLKSMGFQNFFCIRVGYWYHSCLTDVIKAQEQFCAETPDAYMATRALSLFDFPGIEQKDWFAHPVPEEYKLCRDSFYGFNNGHINEHGFEVLSPLAAQNIHRVLYLHEQPVLENENIKALL